MIDIPFFIAGALKIAYDLVLYLEFRAIRPPEERHPNHQTCRDGFNAPNRLLR